jgi:hypothetical protein
MVGRLAVEEMMEELVEELVAKLLFVNQAFSYLILNK